MTIKWPEEALEGSKIPASAKKYLREEGFPEFCDNPWMEFGIYKSNANLVIGEFGECPIIVLEPEGKVVIENAEGIRILANSSVMQLGEFVRIWRNCGSVRETREAMLAIDPNSLGLGENCFWDQVLDYEEALEGNGSPEVIEERSLRNP